MSYRGDSYDDRRDDRRGGDRYDDRRGGGGRYDDRRGGDRYDDRRGGDRYDDRRDRGPPRGGGAPRGANRTRLYVGRLSQNTREAEIEGFSFFSRFDHGPRS